MRNLGSTLCEARMGLFSRSSTLQGHLGTATAVDSLMQKPESFPIELDGSWGLEDLYVFPRTFEQVYFFVMSIYEDFDEDDLERIEYAFSSMPWQGGYSAVTFYNQLKYVVPKGARPRIISIEYASPGWIELSLVLSTALTVGMIVKSIAKTISICNQTYTEIIRGMTERGILRVELEEKKIDLKKSQLAFVKEALEQMVEMFGLEDVRELNRRTGNPYKSLKILLSLYRRVRVLVDFRIKGKAEIPDREEDLLMLPPRQRSRPRARQSRKSDQ